MIALQAGRVSVVVEPVGGALTSLRTGDTEWLARTDTDTVLTGADFAETGFRGWDECFPSISSTVIDRGPDRLHVPDHGWAWARSWTIEEQSATSATLAVDLAEVGCVLRRQIRVTPRAVHLDYRVRNESSTDLSFVWAGHGLFAAAEDLTVTGLPAPSRVEKVSPGVDPVRPWPKASDGHHHWSDVASDSHAKWFTRWPADGITLVRGSDRLVLRAERRDAAPMVVGVWQNRTARFGGSGWGHLGVEPGIGDHDDLADAVADGTAGVLGAGRALEWTVALHPG